MKPRLTRRHAAGFAAAATVALFAASLAAASSGGTQQTAGSGAVQLHNGTVASGGTVATADCYSLLSTVGEPVAGTVSNGTYRLTSGFAATISGQVSTGTFTVFKDSFEGNDQGGCTP